LPDNYSDFIFYLDVKGVYIRIGISEMTTNTCQADGKHVFGFALEITSLAMKNIYMRAVNIRYYFILLCIGIGLLLFVFYFTYLRYHLIWQSNNTAHKTNESVHAYEELSDDYKSAVIIYASTGLVSAKYLEMYSGDAHDMLPDVDLIKLSAEDNESRKRADTLEQQLKEQSAWILRRRVKSADGAEKSDNRLNEIFDTKAIIDRGEMHVRELSTNHKAELQRSFLSIYEWLLILISTSATLIIAVVVSILSHIRKDKRNLQKIGLQKGQLDDIAWIQSHKVRSQVATILGLAQLFNYDDANDENNSTIISGLKETTEKLDEIIKEIDAKTRDQRILAPQM